MSEPKIITMGQDSASKYVPSERTILISIRSPGSVVPEFQPGYVDILFLEFEDDCFEGWETRQRGMTVVQGALVARFVEKNRGKFDVILVHCFVGVSRSVSMAMALAMELLIHYPEWPSRVPNRNVYITTRQAFKAVAA